MVYSRVCIFCRGFFFFTQTVNSAPWLPRSFLIAHCDSWILRSLYILDLSRQALASNAPLWSILIADALGSGDNNRTCMRTGSVTISLITLQPSCFRANQRHQIRHMAALLYPTRFLYPLTNIRECVVNEWYNVHNSNCHCSVHHWYWRLPILNVAQRKLESFEDHYSKEHSIFAKGRYSWSKNHETTLNSPLRRWPSHETIMCLDFGTSRCQCHQSECIPDSEHVPRIDSCAMDVDKWRFFGGWFRRQPTDH